MFLHCPQKGGRAAAVQKLLQKKACVEQQSKDLGQHHEWLVTFDTLPGNKEARPLL